MRRCRVSIIEYAIVRALVKAAAGPGFTSAGRAAAGDPRQRGAHPGATRRRVRHRRAHLRLGRVGAGALSSAIHRRTRVRRRRGAGRSSRHRRARGRPGDGRGTHRVRTMPPLPHGQRARLPEHAASSAWTATAASRTTSRCRRRTSGTWTMRSPTRSAAFTIRWATRSTRRSRTPRSRARRYW